ncbi:MAG: HEAT repeat domain-containing protein [Polyangiaceae bacterium]
MLDKIVALLDAEAIEKRIAAAIVLGELRVKSPEATQGLLTAMGSGIPLLQCHAIEALGRAKPAKAVAPLLDLAASTQAEVRQATKRALGAYGEEIVPQIKARMASANPEERRALDAVLAELGGKSAFATLLASMTSQEEEAAKRAAVGMRQVIKSADGRERRTYLAETEKFIEKARASKEPHPAAIIGAIKILGFLEDERAIPTLLSCATDKKSHPHVRQEAFIAVRFCMTGKRADKKLVDALVTAAESPDRTLAQAALLTLASIEVAPEATKRLFSLVAHQEFERARLVIEHLSRRKDAESAAVLIDAVLKLDKPRADLAMQALLTNEAAANPLARALIETKDSEKSWTLRTALKPMARNVSTALKKALREELVSRLAASDRGWEAILDTVRDIDSAAFEADLRALHAKVDRTTKTDKALSLLRILCKFEFATDEDRMLLAHKTLRQNDDYETRPEVRAKDESLRLMGELARRGYDVGKVLLKDKKLPIEALYYVGFHFAEAKHGLGEELLEEVISRAGRTKVGKMAKNKLALSNR